VNNPGDVRVMEPPMKPSPLRWWRVVVRWGDRIVVDRCVRAGEELRIGEGTACAIPGIAVPEHAILQGDRVRGGAGLSCEIERDGGLQPVTADDVTLAPGERAWLRPVANPDIAIEIEAQTGERFRSKTEFLAGLARDAGYGVAVLGCVLALFAVVRLQSATKVNGEGGTTRIERAMHEATPIASFSMPPPRPVAAAPVIAVEPERVDALAVEPSLAEPAEIEVLPARRAPVAKPKPSPQRRKSARRDSHTAPGDTLVPGVGDGKAAVAPRTCDDPRIEPKSQVDVVFVLDVSTTMGFVLDELSDEIAAVDAAVRKHDATPHYGLVVFVDDVMVVRGGEPFTDIRALAKEFDRWAKFTADNRQIRAEGDNLDWPENTLDALHAAATRFAWRDADDTVRVVVHATDDGFASAGDVLSGTVGVQHDYSQTVTALADAHVRVATFTARIGGKCECEDVTAGFMAPHGGASSLPDATGGAAFDLDEVARGRLHFADAIPSLVTNAVCDE
jgi:hypothetical protein